MALHRHFGVPRSHSTERELADITLAMAAKNAGNRLWIAARLPAGTYQPAAV
jgi:hypothetical protein